MTGFSESSTPLWRLSDVRFSRRERPVLRGFDCVIPAGRCTGILGPNGSGKTTLLDLLCGLVRPQSGDILFQGRPLAGYRRRDLARMLALVPQDFPIRFAFTAREVVEMGLHPHLGRFARPDAADRARMEAVMDQCGILSLAERPVTRLSGGERQRVALARALAQRPQVLLLDEATSGLDIRHTLFLLELLRDKVRTGELTLVAVLHDLNLAARFCDEAIILHEGRCRAQGPTAEVLRPDIIREVYGVDSEMGHDTCSDAPRISLRLPQKGATG